jgi:hypothetical protein
MKNFTPFILLALLAAFSAQAKRPNILFIIADDQSPFDFKAYNPSSPLDAPAIGKLAAEGMTFDQAYHMGSMSGAVCSPSRRMFSMPSATNRVMRTSLTRTASPG